MAFEFVLSPFYIYLPTITVEGRLVLAQRAV